MKLAVVYDNGEIFQHFGHANEFKIYSIENGEIVLEGAFNNIKFTQKNEKQPFLKRIFK